MVATMVARNAKRLLLGLAESRLAGVWSPAVSYVLCVWQESSFSHRKGFFILIDFLRNFINFALSMRIAKIMLQ
jgi:hypothetical protein